jgi:chromosome segregation ATPase
METDKLTQLEQNFATLAGFVERATKSLGRIEKTLKEHERKIDEALQRSSHQEDDDDSCEGFGPKPERQPFNPNAETYTLELHHGPYTIRRDDGESDKEWQRRKDHLMDQRVTFLNGSGQNGTPEQVAHLQRIEQRLGRKIFANPLATT